MKIFRLRSLLLIGGLLNFATFVFGQSYSFTTLAGLASQGSADGPATNAQFFAPQDVWVDAQSNVFVADSDNDTIREITPDGTVATIAGQAGSPGYADATGTNALFFLPKSLTGDASGNLYVADTFNEVVRKLTRSGSIWVVSTLAGQPDNAGYAEGATNNAQFSSPSGITVDAAGNVYVTDQGNDLIRKITPAGLVSTIAGQLGEDTSLDGTNRNAEFARPLGLAIDHGTNLYVTDGDNTIRRMQPQGTNWVVTTIAGQPDVYGSTDALGTNALFSGPDGIAVDAQTNVYVADAYNETVRRLTLVVTNWMVSTIAGAVGTQGYADGTNNAARFGSPAGVGTDPAGDVLVADVNNNNIRKITLVGTNGVVTTLAGVGPGGTDGPGDIARFWNPTGVAVDSSGNAYVADADNDTIRRIGTNDVVTTIAGLAGTSGSSDGTNAAARFKGPQAVALDAQGNLYVADSYNNSIRELTPSGTNWIVTTLAGNAALPGAELDGTGTNAQFYTPVGIAVDTHTNLYVTDNYGQTVRKLSLVGTNWVVATIAGQATTFGYTNGPGTNALFFYPHSIAVDAATNVYVADTENQVIRKLSPAGTNWAVTTIAGMNGMNGSSDGLGTNILFYFPEGITVDKNGDLYVADTYNDTLRLLIPAGTNWVSTTLGGLAQTGGSVGGLGTSALFNQPQSVAVDPAGNLYVADTGNNSVRFGELVAGPALAVTSAGRQATLSWFNAGSYTLQTNSNLTSGNWINYSGTVTTTNGTNAVTFTPAAGPLFFRLINP